MDKPPLRTAIANEDRTLTDSWQRWFAVSFPTTVLQSVAVKAAMEIPAPAPITDGVLLVVFVQQDAAGHAVTWNAAYRFGPSVDASPNSITLASFVSRGGEWWAFPHVAASGPWTDAVLENGWTNVGAGAFSAGYRIEEFGARLFFRGLVEAGTTTSGTVIATLPAGMRPTNAVIVATGCSDDGLTTFATAFVEVLTNGEVTIYGVGANTRLYLDGLSLPLT